MKDIEFGLFAQIAYYNWHNYDKKEKNLYQIFNDKKGMNILTLGKSDTFNSKNTEFEVELSNGNTAKLYREEDKRLLMMYSEDKDNPKENQKYKNLFEGWELIEGTDHANIFNETQKESLDVIGSDEKTSNTIGIRQEDSGFQASAFKKGNTIVISYRGTDFGEEDFSADMYSTNKKIWFGEIVDQVLCTIYFYEKIKNSKEAKGCTLYVTGHSLGGGLAQFASIYGGHEIKTTKTWNALGIQEDFDGSNYDNLKKSFRFNFDYCLSYLEKEGYINKNKDIIEWTSKEYPTNSSDIDEFISNFLDKDNKDFEKEWESLSNVYRVLSLSRLFQKLYKNYHNMNDKLFHYYLENDIVRELSSKTGTPICVDNPINSTNDGGAGASASSLIGEGDFAWHGINNFLPFFNDEGSIRPDKLHKNYISNFIKTSLAKNLDSDLVLGYKTTGSYGAKPLTITKEVIITEILLNKNRKNLNKITKVQNGVILLADELIESFEKGIVPYEIEGTEIILGKFGNYEIIGGVLGGEEIRLDLIEILKNQHPEGRKIDYISETLLRSEFKKNGLNFMVKEGEYNFFSSVVETMHTKDLNIFDLAEKALNQPDDARIYLEQVIEDAIPQGEVKSNYKAKENWTPTDTSKIKKLYEQASKTKRPFGTQQVSTPKSKKFYKSFLEPLEEQEQYEENSRNSQDRRIATANRQESTLGMTGKPSLISVGKDRNAWSRIGSNYKNV